MRVADYMFLRTLEFNTIELEFENPWSNQFARYAIDHRTHTLHTLHTYSTYKVNVKQGGPTYALIHWYQIHICYRPQLRPPQ